MITENLSRIMELSPYTNIWREAYDFLEGIPLAFIAEETEVSKRKEKVVVSSDSEGSDADDFSELKKITALKDISQKIARKAKSRIMNIKRHRCLLAEKDKDEQVLLAKDQAWMESSSDSNQEINSNIVFMAQIEKVLSDSETSSSSADDKISESAVDHNDSKGVDKLIRNFNKKIAKCLKRIEKANQQNKDFENQNKNLQVKYDVLKNQATTFEMNNKELNEQLKVLLEKNDDLLAQTNVLKDQLYIADQEVLYDKMSVQLVELDKHVRDLKNTVLEKDFKISKLEECVRNKNLEIEKCLERLNVCENKLHKMGQTNQTVHMIMPSKDKMYNDRKGIGFENPSYFPKAKDLRPTLYDERVFNLGYTLMFLTHSDEAWKLKSLKEQEKIKLSLHMTMEQTSSLKPYVMTVILEKIIIDLEDEVVSLLEKEKENLKTIESLKSKDVKTGDESSEKVVSETENQSENDRQVVKKECDNVENSKVIAPWMFKLSVSQSVSPISVTKMSYASNGVESKLRRKRRKIKSSKQHNKQVNKDVLHANKAFVYFSYLDTLSSVRRPKSNGVIWTRKGSSNTVKVDLSDVNHSNLNKNVKRELSQKLDGIMNASVDVNDLFVFDNIVQICLWIIDSGCSKHMTGNRALLKIFMEKFLGTVRFGNNDFAVIADGVDLLTGDRSSNLYTIALNEVASNSLTCLLAKASSSQSWLWHQRLSHLNFTTINNLVKNNLVQGLPKMKFKKDHLCFACEQRKIHRKHHKSKIAFALNKPLYLLYLDLCGPMHVKSINRKRYVLVVVDDYSRYTWIFFLHSKDEASEVIISFIKKIQVNPQLQVQRVRTDNDTKFKNKTLAKFFDEVGISQKISAARTPKQNGVVERRNRTLVEAARTMLTFANLPLFLSAETIATACFTQNRLIIHKRFDKTPYELMNKIKPNIKLFCVFGCRCYLLNDYEDVGNLKAKGDIGVFVGYSKESAAFRIYNK
nr:hypothetical protein [Tanacetum cinerariifolium]